MERLSALYQTIRACKLCEEKGILPEANPILQVSEQAKIAICGQAPGNLAHQAGKPFADPSGDRLRAWLGVTEQQFYDSEKIAIVPMAFCFPGYDGKSPTGKGGDLPPPRLCAETWRAQIMEVLGSNLELIILVGGYAQNWHLKSKAHSTLTETVKNWRSYVKGSSEAGEIQYIPLPHPSWRNNGWLKKNSWFSNELVPYLQAEVRDLIG